MSLKNVDWEENVGGGFLCSAERIVRKATRLDASRYGVSPRDASPLPGTGLFCRPKATISNPSVLSMPRHSTAQFSKSDDLEIVTSRGKVLWSARDGVDLRRAGEKSGRKSSPDVSKGKHGKRGRKKDERDKEQTRESKPNNVDGGTRGWKWGRNAGGSDVDAPTTPSGGQRRGIARVLGWVRQLHNK